MLEAQLFSVVNPILRPPTANSLGVSGFVILQNRNPGSRETTQSKITSM